jgi:hypothetical protein
MNQDNASECPIINGGSNIDATIFFLYLKKFWWTIMGWVYKSQ